MLSAPDACSEGSRPKRDVLHVVNAFVLRFMQQTLSSRGGCPLCSKCFRVQIYIVNALMQGLPGTLTERNPSKADFLHKVIQTVAYNCDAKCSQIFDDFSGPLCGKCGQAGLVGGARPAII